MTTKPMIRHRLVLDTENDRAVILRQGPRRRYRMIVWHRDTDTFEDGQYFLHSALDGRWRSVAKGSFTALSKPPHRTALSFPPQGDIYGDSGQFIDNRHYQADGDADIIEQIRAPCDWRPETPEGTPEPWHPLKDDT